MTCVSTYFSVAKSDIAPLPPPTFTLFSIFLYGYPFAPCIHYLRFGFHSQPRSLLIASVCDNWQRYGQHTIISDYVEWMFCLYIYFLSVICSPILSKASIFSSALSLRPLRPSPCRLVELHRSIQPPGRLPLALGRSAERSVSLRLRGR
jgi:hypothetical protein